MKRLSRVFFLFGLLCLSVAAVLLARHVFPSSPTFNIRSLALTDAQQLDGAKPIALVIPSQTISAAIIPASISDGRWETTKSGVSYLSSSPVPGNRGNSILYGHNRAVLLGRLPRVRPRDRIKILFDDGSSRTFVVETTAVVSPKQVDILNQTETSRLTIFTCVGLFDEKRFVAVATPIEES